MKELQDLAVIEFLEAVTELGWKCCTVCTFSTFFLILRDFFEEMKLVVLTDGINSNS